MPTGIYIRTKPVWNKGLKGYSNKGSFQKGHKYVGPKEYRFKKGQKGKRAGHWKGGVVKSMGYILIFQPSHPRATKVGYVKKANLIMEKKLGRYLTPEEVVHHLNGIKTDDRPKNLQLFINCSKHTKFHYQHKNKLYFRNMYKKYGLPKKI